VSDISKVREIWAKDGDWEEWPYPTVTIESVISGELRSRVLRVLELEDTGQEVVLVENKVSGGYSEYTQENDFGIEVKVAGVRQWHEDWASSQESAMAGFLAKFALEAL
jgi:hypothetical protein